MANKYLDYDGLNYFWSKIKALFSTKSETITNITRSGTTFTATRADNTTFTFTQQDNTVSKTTTTPKMDGTAAVGSETKYAAGDHVHPTDTSRAPLDSPAFTGTPTAPTAASSTDSTQIATTEFVHDLVDGIASVPKTTTTPKMDGTAAVGTENAYAAGDHVHPTDTSRVPTTRTVNGHALSSNVTITNLDLGHTVQIFSNDQSTTVKTASLTGYKLVHGGVISVVFFYPVNANATLNINSTGAKPIYYHGAAIGNNIIAQQSAAILVYNSTADRYDIVSIEPAFHIDSINSNGGSTSDALFTVRYGYGSTSVGYTFSLVPSAKVGAANGVAPLDANSKIDSQYLPSYVDDVVEAYAVGSTPLAADWLSLTASGSALTPESGKIYILMVTSGDYEANTQFRWGGTTYVKLNDGGVSAITTSEIDTIVAS